MVGEADERAAAAERSVGALFGGRLAGMPLTHLGRVTTSAAGPRPLFQPWHYWWQAHYLDAIVDAGERTLCLRGVDAARRRSRLGGRLLATMWLRNGGRFTNDYFDDMAWVLLAVARLDRLDEAVSRRGRRWLVSSGYRALSARLAGAVTDDLGGGVWWNTTRDFKNAPATGPWALHLARSGDEVGARRLVDWMWQRLRDPVTGLVADGIRVLDGPAGRAEQAVPDVYTYNQGTLLGALVALGDAESLERAAGLVDAVARGLTRPVGDRVVLVTHGSGDGGLFTGILVRYLALAMGCEALDPPARETAARLVRDTAEALWEGRATRGDVLVFSPDPRMPASDAQPDGAPLELSTQLQAWTILEAAATL